MSLSVHTIVGANGAIGKGLYDILSKNTNISVRTVSRSVTTDAAQISASVLDKNALQSAIDGSSVVYFVIGMVYDINIWKRDWPVAVDNIIAACEHANATLIFADNLYAYGDYGEGMVRPSIPYTTTGTPSKKALVRAIVARKIEEAGKAGRIQYAIIRASDFYGPKSFDVSHFGEFSIGPLLENKPAKFIVEFDRYKHSITYDNDFSKALAVVGLAGSKGLGKVWHVPNAPAKTFKEYAEIISQVIGKPNPPNPVASLVMPGFLLAMLKPFWGFLKELADLPQIWGRDYIVDSSEFEKVFGDEFGQPMDLHVGFKHTVEAFKLKLEMGKK
jgi:nucleoside-diphosphate-sugar epimerase